MDQLVELCALHAAYEKCEYNKEGKSELLRKAIFNISPELYCVVACENKSILGYTSYMKQYSTWDASYYMYLDCIFLKDNARGKGIGDELMKFVGQKSLREGIELLQWQTPDFNERAIKFYRRIGAVSLAKERFFWSLK